MERVERDRCCDCKVTHLAGLVVNSRRNSAAFSFLPDDVGQRQIRRGPDAFSVLCNSSLVMNDLKSEGNLCPDCIY